MNHKQDSEKLYEILKNHVFYPKYGNLFIKHHNREILNELIYRIAKETRNKFLAEDKLWSVVVPVDISHGIKKINKMDFSIINDIENNEEIINNIRDDISTYYSLNKLIISVMDTGKRFINLSKEEIESGLKNVKRNGHWIPIYNELVEMYNIAYTMVKRVEEKNSSDLSKNEILALWQYNSRNLEYLNRFCEVYFKNVRVDAVFLNIFEMTNNEQKFLFKKISYNRCENLGTGIAFQDGDLKANFDIEMEGLVDWRHDVKDLYLDRSYWTEHESDSKKEINDDYEEYLKYLDAFKLDEKIL